jgi:TRAP-type mannitol/chloroaromatic compound transport system permease small subunit
MNGGRTLPASGTGHFAAFRRAADGLALAGGYAAALCLAALLALVTAEILLALASKVFKGLPPGIGIAWEYSSYLMGISFLLGSGLTLRAGMHIRVELLLHVWGGRLTRLFEIKAAFIGAAFSGVLAWSLGRFALQSFNSGQVSGESLTPLWIPQSALTVGAAVLFVQMLLRLISALLDKPLEDKTLGVATLPE